MSNTWHWGHDGESAKLYDSDGALVTEPPVECVTTDWLGFDRDPSARLIAEAPAMLEALKTLVTCLVGMGHGDHGHRECEYRIEDAIAARAIIARIEGAK